MRDTHPEPQRLIVPVLAEVPRVRKRTVARPGVRVEKRVRTRTEQVSVELERGDLAIERRGVNLLYDEPPQVRQEGETTVVPVIEEVVILETKYLVREEVRVTRLRERHCVSSPITLRREEVSITEAPPASRSDGAPFSGKPIDVPASEEAPDVATELRRVEEIALVRRSEEQQASANAMLAEQRVEVTPLAAAQNEHVEEPARRTPMNTTNTGLRPSQPSRSPRVVVTDANANANKTTGTSLAHKGRPLSPALIAALILAALVILYLVIKAF